MKNLENPLWMYVKAALFVFLGLGAAALIILENPTLTTAVLLALTVWCFCRSYYFAFYVVEKYVDSKYKFSGLGSFLVYLLKNHRQR